MKTPSKKWLIIIAVAIAALAFGKYNEAQTAKEKKVEAVPEPQILLTYEESFDKKYLSSWDGSYRPVEKYLKANLNNPSSLEIDKTWNLGMTKDSSFAIKTTYRAKNAFNAVVLEAIYCNIDIDGNLTEIRTE